MRFFAAIDFWTNSWRKAEGERRGWYEPFNIAVNHSSLIWLETKRVTCSARSVSSTGISLLRLAKLCAVSNVLSAVCKIGKPCLIAVWQNASTCSFGVWCSVRTKPASGIPLLLAKLDAKSTSIRSDALMISSPATNLCSSCSMFDAIKLLCNTRRWVASP